MKGESVVFCYLANRDVADAEWNEWLPEGSVLLGHRWDVAQWAGAVWAALPFMLTDEAAKFNEKLPEGVNGLRMTATGAPPMNIGKLADELRCAVENPGEFVGFNQMAAMPCEGAERS